MKYIISVIIAYRGDFKTHMGLVFGSFKDPVQAAAAMNAIVTKGFAVARCGSKLTVEC
jgi:hypothetical protein